MTIDQLTLELLRESQRQQLQVAVLRRRPAWLSADELDAHFARMPARYWTHVNEADVLWHLATLHEFFDNLEEKDAPTVAPIVRWRHFPGGGYTEVLICTWDRLGLCAKVAGSFATVGINIFHADIYTRDDDVVLDIFRVYDQGNFPIRDESRLDTMAGLLAVSLSQQSDGLFARLGRLERQFSAGRGTAASTVVFDNNRFAESTFLQIVTADRLGLLHDIMRALTESDVNIRQAIIHTEKSDARDAFHLNDRDGGKILDDSRLRSIEKRLLDAIT